jgi:hypothetical protein
MPPGTPPEKAAELQKNLHVVSSEICPSSCAGKQVVELDPDGGEHSWELLLPERPQFECSTKRGEKLGMGYVMLTSGKKTFFSFPLIEDEVWTRVAGMRENA